MFPLPFSAPYDAILYALFGLDLVLLAAGLACGRLSADGTGRLPLPLRMALSALLVVAAGLFWWQARSGAALRAYAAWVLAGMGLGFLGDLIMARLIPVPDRLIAGMLAFGLGHVAYIVGFAGLSASLGRWPERWHLALWAIMLAVGLALWHTLVQQPGGKRALNAGALVYGLLVATMNALALGLGIRDLRFVPLAVGAVLFLASDTILGHWVIRGHGWRRVNDVVWVTYNLGQLLIVYSVGAAANALRCAL